MIVAISANTSWNLVNFRLNLMKDLREQGHEVIAIAPSDESTSKLLAEGFKFFPLKSLARKGSNPFHDLRLMNEYKKIFKSQKVDIALLYTIKPVIYGNLATKGTKVFSIATITGLGYTFLNKGFTSSVAKKLYKLALKSCDKVFFQNSDDKELFENSSIIPKGESSVINGSGIDTKGIVPVYIKERPLGEMNFMFVGRMLIDKGVVELLKAFRNLNMQFAKTRLTLIGGLDFDNPSMIPKDVFDRLIDHPNIAYLGESNEVLSNMKDSDIVILPSYREGIPRVLLEAMSLGKPIISTDVAGCRQVLTHNQNGLMCIARSEETLFKVMQDMAVLDYSLRLEMGKEGRRLVEKNYDQTIISKTYIDLIESATNL